MKAGLSASASASQWLRAASWDVSSQGLPTFCSYEQSEPKSQGAILLRELQVQKHTEAMSAQKWQSDPSDSVQSPTGG